MVISWWCYLKANNAAGALRVALIVSSWQVGSEEVERERVRHFDPRQIPPIRAKNGVFALDQIRNGPKRAKNSVFVPKIPFFAEIVFVEHTLS